jgi:hypothetical protein
MLCILCRQNIIVPNISTDIKICNRSSTVSAYNFFYSTTLLCVFISTIIYISKIISLGKVKMTAKSLLMFSFTLQCVYIILANNSRNIEHLTPKKGIYFLRYLTKSFLSNIHTHVRYYLSTHMIFVFESSFLISL